jgi:predicted RNA-binding protein YlxR (DUF448 family)
MTAKPVKRVKHIPQRTCVGCRTTLAKRSLIRVVRTPEGVSPDPTGKRPGRGAYLHNQRSCWERGLRGALAHALKTELLPADREVLEAFAAALPQEPDADRPAM